MSVAAFPLHYLPMFIPLRTNRAPRRRPIVTQAIIVINLVVYLTGLVTERFGIVDRETLIGFGHLWRLDFHPWQLLTYQFLHDPYDVFHLGFNLLFLWVFGCAVEDRLGRASYAGFYLIGGAVAGIAHMVLEPAPVIGASGSVSAVSGAFLALFPRAKVQVLVFFFLIGLYAIPAMWFIGFYFMIDILRATGAMFGTDGDRVAFMAHIAGSLYGFTLAFILLATEIVKREEFDVFFLIKQRRRRAEFRRTARRQVGGTWESASADTDRELRGRAKSDVSEPPTPSAPMVTAETEARTEIDRLLTAHDLDGAASRYTALLEAVPTATLSEDRQLDIANQLSRRGEDEHAARAYELFLKAYPAGGKSAEIRLLLGVLYARRLGEPSRARELIEQARARLVDTQQRALADQLLTEIGA